MSEWLEIHGTHRACFIKRASIISFNDFGNQWTIGYGGHLAEVSVSKEELDRVLKELGIRE